MKVTRIRMHGFKSFADAIEVPVNPGLTGLVGPNGCGKSNLVDALRFVMGESSYKAMRGSGMEDVIFSGAGSRSSRNMAEVTLQAERDEGTGRGPEVVEISRRIERDAGSTYRINGRDVRARDVQLLFADAATGAHSSALVRQGQVAELIAARPEKRRSILEDAAGISGLHARRHEAEQKLKGAEQNMARVVDVMAEIESQLEGLRRQARQAVRYRKISGEIRALEAVLYLIHWEGALARLAEAEAARQAAGELFAVATEAQAAAAVEEATAGRRLPALRSAAGDATGALDRARLAVSELDREERQLKARREELVSRRGQAAADLAHEKEIAADASTALERLDTEHAELAATNAAASERVATARHAAETAAAAVTAREAEFAAAAGALAAAGAERTARERAIRESQAKLRRLDDSRTGITAERDRVMAVHGSDAAIAEATQALVESEAAVAARDAEVEAAAAALHATREAERQARAPREAAERAIGALEAEARTLSDMLDLARASRFPPLSDQLSVAPGYAKALAAALGDDLDASLDPAAPAVWGPSGAGESDPALPEGAEPLARFVTGPANLTRRLRQVGVVDQERAASLHGALATGQRLVTRAGGLWRWDGFRAEPGSAASGARRLESRARLHAVTEELRDARAALDVARRAYTDAVNRRSAAEQSESGVRISLQQARHALDASRRALGDAERQRALVAEKLSAFSGALSRMEADAETSRAELAAAEDALQALPDAGDLAARRDAVQADLAGERGRAAEARLASERAAHEETLRMRRLAEIATERDRWASRLARAEERVGELRTRMEALEAEIATVPDDPELYAERRRELAARTSGAEDALASAAAALGAAESAHGEAQDAARDALEALSLARETRGRDEERVIAATERKAELAAQIDEHFSTGAGAEANLRALAGLDGDAPLPDGEVSESRLHKLKTERERLGGVNLRAEEEAEELETRLGTMRSEHDDLEEAIKRLRTGIQSLNREGRQRLLAAFETVNGHFVSLFTHLFGGGTAELSLSGSDDPLECGLDIIARPPGKKPQTMTLLSGGEQALTAMALIFAVFLTNPSPICVLDEVDAPLDDANVERFCSLIDDMRRRTETRFVVVTHNPITMARMDRLFGVTMAERGVSQVVSVDLVTAEQFREAS